MLQNQTTVDFGFEKSSRPITNPKLFGSLGKNGKLEVIGLYNHRRIRRRQKVDNIGPKFFLDILQAESYNESVSPTGQER